MEGRFLLARGMREEALLGKRQQFGVNSRPQQHFQPDYIHFHEGSEIQKKKREVNPTGKKRNNNGKKDFFINRKRFLICK